MKKTILAAISVSFLCVGCVALQQDVSVLEQRLQTMESRNRELQKQNESLSQQVQTEQKSTERNMRGHYAELNATVEAAQQDLRLLKGRVEEIEYLINRKIADSATQGGSGQERLDELSLATQKMEQRLAQVEQYLNLESKKLRPVSNVPVEKAAQKVSASDEQLYSDARRAFDNGEMDKARQLFQKLIATYPTSENVDNAQFWIGESYYREKWYEKAIIEYQEVIEKYPNGNKVPSAMLKQGLSLKQIGEAASARLILQELVKKYPKSTEAAIAEQKLQDF